MFPERKGKWLTGKRLKFRIGVHFSKQYGKPVAME
jgi:hypothetical protein